MIKRRLREKIAECFQQGVAAGHWTAAAGAGFTVEEPKQTTHGDFATNLAMIIAGREKKKPREVAAQLVELLAGAGD